MTEDNNPSHENKGERSKDDTENIKARERTNARKITTGESFLVVVAPFFISLIFSRRRSMTRKNNFLFKSNRSRVEEMPSPSPSSSSEKFKTALVRASDAYFMRKVRCACSSVLLLLEVETYLKSQEYKSEFYEAVSQKKIGE